MSLTVGDHDPIPMLASFGYWIECECGWIGPTANTAQAARDAHRKHSAPPPPPEPAAAALPTRAYAPWTQMELW